MSGFHTPDDVKAVEQMIGAFMSLYPNAEWGPAHIALSDDNLRDSDLELSEAILPRIGRFSEMAAAP